jgi:hypothetical protein
MHLIPWTLRSGSEHILSSVYTNYLCYHCVYQYPILYSSYQVCILKTHVIKCVQCLVSAKKADVRTAGLDSAWQRVESFVIVVM